MPIKFYKVNICYQQHPRVISSLNLFYHTKDGHYSTFQQSTITVFFLKFILKESYDVFYFVNGLFYSTLF